MIKKIVGILTAVILTLSPIAVSGTAWASTGGGTTSTAPAPASVSGNKIVKQGAKYIGYRYVWGGASPSRGFDCSGFTNYTFKRLGKSIPRVASDQYRHSKHVRTPRAGDLVFVHDSSGHVYHVGIYVNSHTWLESERPGKGVNYYHPWTKRVYYGRYYVK
jgi:cell wall-associated NlpC family hydrolase